MFSVVDISVKSLVPFSLDPFGKYSEQRLQDLVESIQANGMLVPIIVRPAKDGLYEILSGNNRVEAAKAASLEVVPAIIREGLTDDEALLIAVETNLLQRSFAELSHSERAAALTVHYDAIKSQGRRADMIKEVELMLQDGPDGTCAPVEHKLKARERIGMEYGLSKNTVARYLRVNKLSAPHKARLDSGAIAIRTAVLLSYLSADEQEIVDDVIKTNHCKLSAAEAETLRSESKPLNRETIQRIVEDNKRGTHADVSDAPDVVGAAGAAGEVGAVKSDALGAFTLGREFLERYFKPNQNQDEIEAIIATALERYLKS